MPAPEVAVAHYAERQKLVHATAAAGVALWQQIDPVNLAESWARLLPRLLVILQGAQLAAASSANPYANAVLAAQGVAVAPASSVSATAFVGTASDGWPLQGLLQQPVVAAKTFLKRGAPMARSLASGRASLEMILRTQVADAGRVADGVAIAARPQVGWVRMLVGDSCYRCVILAGRFYRYSDGFERHPQDDCISIPAVEDTAGDYRTDPRQAFDEGRVTDLSEADAQAIRDGADMAQVVNAHQGMTTAGGVKTTTAGTSRRGLAGQRLQGAPRLMPEAIYEQATNREDALRLLQLHGYLI